MYEIKKSKNRKFYFVFKARNGEVIVTSEMYESKQSAKHGISVLRKSFFANVVDNSHIPAVRRNSKGRFEKVSIN